MFVSICRNSENGPLKRTPLYIELNRSECSDHTRSYTVQFDDGCFLADDPEAYDWLAKECSDNSLTLQHQTELGGVIVIGDRRYSREAVRRLFSIIAAQLNDVERWDVDIIHAAPPAYQELMGNLTEQVEKDGPPIPRPQTKPIVLSPPSFHPHSEPARSDTQPQLQPVEK